MSEKLLYHSHQATQKAAAQKFADTWQGRGYEKGETQLFLVGLLRDVFGVQDIEKYVLFEEQVKIAHTNFLDVRIPNTHVTIEQKSLGVDLAKKAKQADGQERTPFEQAKWYAFNQIYEKHPRYIVTCNFAEFRVYDMNKEDAETCPEIIYLEDLPHEYHRLEFLIDAAKTPVKPEEISVKAGEIIHDLYEAIKKEYISPDSAEAMKSLNKLCVRLVFCMYAEDAGVFGKYGMFREYLRSFKPENMREALISLFETLDKPEEKRDPYMKTNLAEFPYVNGDLFADSREKLQRQIPYFTEEISAKLYQASAYFDWSKINPTIFGAIFESTLNPNTRRHGGMHYTSIENIHKVIDPLFLDELNDKLKEALSYKGTHYKTVKARRDRLLSLQNELAGLTFLDIFTQKMIQFNYSRRAA